MLVINVDLLRPTFHGLAEGGRVDWPPSPLRLAGALTAGAYALQDHGLQRQALAAIDQLVAERNPDIYAPEKLDLAIPATFTQRTGIPEKLTANELGKVLDVSIHGFDTSSRSLKPLSAVALDGRSLSYVVESLDLDDDRLEALDAAAQHVPYFGRSQDPAVITVANELVERGAGRSKWIPVDSPGGKSRGWQSNSPQWMQINFEIVRDARKQSLLSAHGYSRTLRYMLVGESAQEGTSPEGTSPVVLIPVQQPIASQHVPKLMRRLNEKLEQQNLVGSAVAFPAVFSAFEHSDGRCLGIGFTVVNAHEVLSNETLSDLTGLVRGLTIENDSRPILRPNRATLQTSRWTKAASTWKSATPLRGFPDIRVLDYALRSEIQSKYGQSLTVEVVRAETEPIESWHVRWPTADFQDGLTQWWVQLELSGAISGPLQLGASTDLGFGLFSDVPEDDKDKGVSRGD